MRILSAIALMVVLTGCETSQVSQRQYEAVDAADRTMTVPPGSVHLLGAIKDALSQPGWKMSVDRGPDLTTGTVGEKTKLATGNTFLTPYRLVIRARDFATDACAYLKSGEANPVVVYDLSVIDNKDGHEVLTQNGKGCVSDVAGQFVDRLNGVPPPPCRGATDARIWLPACS
jgi:hypothetical protein